MCLTFFHLFDQNSKNFEFVMSFNREEQTQRKTLAFGQYSEDENIYGGRDIVSTGTWLGLNIKTGLLVFLTNYDLQYTRKGQSRGKLVYSFLTSKFMTEEQIGSNLGDNKIYNELVQVLKERKSFSAFNLTIYNILTSKIFYICSEWDHGRPFLLESDKTYALCNSDINVSWPKVNFGQAKFHELIKNIESFSKEDIVNKMQIISENKTRFSYIDDDQSSILVQPYYCLAEKAERMTKSSFFCLITREANKRVVTIKEITHSKHQTNTTVEFTFVL